MRDVDKLMDQIKRGNMAEIALSETLNGYFARKRNEKVVALIGEFRMGKQPHEMLSSIAALSAIGEMEDDLKAQVSRRNSAEKSLREMEQNDGQENRY